MNRFNDVVIVVFESFTKGLIDDRDFDLESDARNVLGFETDGTLRWTLPDVPRKATGSDAHYYRRLYSLNGKPYVHHCNERLYAVDVSGGTLPESWPSNQVPIADTVTELDGKIMQVIDTDNRIFVRCAGEDTELYAFEEDGTEMWSSGPRGVIYLIDGELYENVEHSQYEEDWYRLDQDTGERLEEVEYPL